MLSTLRQFLDLLLRRAGPSDLLASPRLLAGTFAALMAVQGALAAMLGESPSEMLPRATVSGALLLGWIWFLTRVYGHPARFLQTATALLGVTLLSAPVLIPLAVSALGAAATPSDIKPSLQLLLLAAAGLYLLIVESRILADAIEQPVFLCVLLVLAGEFLIGAIALSIGLVPPPPGAAAAPA
jgi:hypothetical protein